MYIQCKQQTFEISKNNYELLVAKKILQKHVKFISNFFFPWNEIIFQSSLQFQIASAEKNVLDEYGSRH